MGPGPTLGWVCCTVPPKENKKNMCRVCVAPRADRIGSPSSVSGPLGCMTGKLMGIDGGGMGHGGGGGRGCEGGGDNNNPLSLSLTFRVGHVQTGEGGGAYREGPCRVELIPMRC